MHSKIGRQEQKIQIKFGRQKRKKWVSKLIKKKNAISNLFMKRKWPHHKQTVYYIRQTVISSWNGVTKLNLFLFVIFFLY